jgi:uncharacterized membrane protein
MMSNLNRLLFAAVATLLAAACTPKSDGTGDTGSSALDPALAGDLTLLGTEPFWGVVIAGPSNATTFTRPDHAAVSAGLPDRIGTKDGAKLTATAAEGKLEMTLTKKDCSDGMSDRTYPYEAEVVWQGETLKGCGVASDKLDALGAQ